MKSNPWWIFAAAAAALFSGVVGGAAWLFWFALGASEQSAVAALWANHADVPILTVFVLLALLGAGVGWVFRGYIAPLRAMAEATRIIAMSHCGHRLRGDGHTEARDLAASINLLADRYQTLQEDVQAQIRAANAAVEEERNTLAALVSKLPQGVLVCNREGTILLYNQHAQYLLERPAKAGEKTHWIGLGRAVCKVLDENLINHALQHIEHRLRQEETTGLVAPFVITRQGGRFLHVRLIPVLDRDKTALTGYILTLEDVTRHTETETRLGKLVRALTEGQRSGVAGIRAAIEAILEYPTMEDEQKRQFHRVIRDEVVKLSQGLDEVVTDYSDYLKAQSALEETLGSDLLATLERRFQSTFGIAVKTSAPAEPLWLRVDSYAIAQAMVFALAQLLESHQAEHIEIRLERQLAFASLAIVWRGAALDMETLRSWGKNTLLADQEGQALTLQDVVERHGGAAWTQIEAETGRHAFRVLLPVVVDGLDESSETTERGATDDDEHYYDFNLFKRPEQRSSQDDLPLNALSYTVLDTETTGLNPSAGDEIIAIGAVRIVNERILKSEAFDCLINPRRPIAESAVAIHGLTTDKLRDKPVIEEVLPRFHRFVEDTVIIGHNVAFDMRFLALKEAKSGIKFSNPVLDTLLLACLIHPYQEEQSLEMVADRLGVPVSGRHTALGDAMTTAQVFLALVPLLAERGIHTLGQASAACESTHYARLRY